MKWCSCYLKILHVTGWVIRAKRKHAAKNVILTARAFHVARQDSNLTTTLEFNINITRPMLTNVKLLCGIICSTSDERHLMPILTALILDILTARVYLHSNAHV